MKLVIGIVVLCLSSVWADDACAPLPAGECSCDCRCNPPTCPDTTTPEPFPTPEPPTPPSTTETPFPDPPAGPPCVVGFTDQDVVTTYDYRNVAVNLEGKFTLSEWYPFSKDECKFRVRFVTKEKKGRMRVDWGGFSFVPHLTNDGKFDGNYRLSKFDYTIEARGRGYHGPDDPIPIPYDVDLTDASDGDWTFFAKSFGGGTHEVHASHVKGCVVHVRYEEKEEDANAGNKFDRISVWTNSYYDVSTDIDGNPVHMTGFCGDRDGDSSNDNDPAFCYYAPVWNPSQMASFVHYDGPSDSDWVLRCSDGEHQGLGNDAS